jgi:hypothetical protein
MCMLILEIATLVAGLVVLIKGKISFSRSLVVRGAMARVIGVVLMLPLPLSIAAGIVVGVALASKGLSQEEIVRRATSIGAIIEIAVYVACVVVAVIIGAIAPKGPAKRRRPDDFEDDDYADPLPDERGARPPAPGTEGGIQSGAASRSTAAIGPRRRELTGARRNAGIP